MKTNLNTAYLEISNTNFNQEYLELLINRITHSNMSLEKDLGNPDSSKNAIRLRDNMRAFKYLMNAVSQDLDEKLIIETGDIVNESAMFIARGYRKTGYYIADTHIPISNPENIHRDMLDLLDKYNTTWKELDSFEREARFHLKFIHIHPFEDGNGRTGRLLLNYNLLKQGIAPVVITDDLIEYYQTYIHENDINGMKNLLKIQSQKELEIMNKLYNGYQTTPQKVARH